MKEASDPTSYLYPLPIARSVPVPVPLTFSLLSSSRSDCISILYLISCSYTLFKFIVMYILERYEEALQLAETILSQYWLLLSAQPFAAEFFVYHSLTLAALSNDVSGLSCLPIVSSMFEEQCHSSSDQSPCRRVGLRSRRKR